MDRDGDNKRQKKRVAEMRGRAAERWAGRYLQLKGYQILARRFRGFGRGVGEVDLIVRRGKVIVFVEVKARDDALVGLDAVSRWSQVRISRAARLWLTTRRVSDAFEVRFDVVVMMRWGMFWRWPAHFRDVWREDPRG